MMPQRTPMSTILITNLDLPLGHALGEGLQRGGHRIRALVDTSRSNGALGDAVDMYYGTTLDPNAVARAANGCDAVVHVPAVSEVDNAESLYAEGVATMENVLTALHHVACPQLIHISSADVSLGNCDRVYWNEDRLPAGQPVNSYVRTLGLVEALVLAAASSTLRTVALRPALLWGLSVDGQLTSQRRLVGRGENLISTTHIDRLVAAIEACLASPRLQHATYYVVDDAMISHRQFLTNLAAAQQIPPPRSGLPFGLAYSAARLRSAFGLAGRSCTDVLRLGRSHHFDDQRARRELFDAPTRGATFSPESKPSATAIK